MLPLRDVVRMLVVPSPGSNAGLLASLCRTSEPVS